MWVMLGMLLEGLTWVMVVDPPAAVATRMAASHGCVSSWDGTVISLSCKKGSECGGVYPPTPLATPPGLADTDADMASKSKIAASPYPHPLFPHPTPIHSHLV